MESKRESEDQGGVSTKQALIYLGIVALCFGTLYPRLFHPMVKNALGFGEPPKTQEVPDVPPQMRMAGHPVHSAAARAAAGRPPPAARHDGSNDGSKSSKGSGGGVMTMVLPMYAVGIVIYLVYTATKVYGGGGAKEKKKKGAFGSSTDLYDLITERLSGIDLEKVLAGNDSEGAEEINKLADYLRQRQSSHNDMEIPKLKEETTLGKKTTGEKKSEHNKKAESEDDEDLDSFLKKCENPELMNPEELEKMQNRLVEMEQRMAQVMGAMKQVQQTSDKLEADIDDDDKSSSELVESESEGSAVPASVEDIGDCSSSCDSDEEEEIIIMSSDGSEDDSQVGGDNIRRRKIVKNNTDEEIGLTP